MRPLIAWKPVGDINMASSRLRAFLPCKYLKARNWPCEIFDYNNIGSYKVVVLQKTYYNEEDVELATYLNKRGVKTVLDICDNDFYNPNNYPKIQQQVERLKNITDSVYVVSVSTPELGKISQFQGKEVVIIDDAIDYQQFNFITSYFYKFKFLFKQVKNAPLRLVWYGNNRTEPEYPPAAGIIDISRILSSLEEVHTDFPLSLSVISNSKELCKKYLGKASFPVKYYEWNRKNFSQLFIQHDVCIIPININPFSICKTNNRLVLSLLMGVPVITDKIPSYEEFSDVVLFSDWKNNLLTYARNLELRQKHIEAGRDYILSKYNRERVIYQWSSLFEKLLH